MTLFSFTCFSLLLIKMQGFMSLYHLWGEFLPFVSVWAGTGFKVALCLMEIRLMSIYHEEENSAEFTTHANSL